jgi:hypothetical protein
MDYILSNFGVTDDEYEQIKDLFDDLCHYASWQLIQKNVKNNHTDDQEDIVQEIRWASIKAAAYFKRQVYLESCMNVARSYVKDPDVIAALDKLESLWHNRTKHGANKQKFGEPQEQELERIIDRYVPDSDRPKKRQPLQFNRKFVTYCKAIIWNRQKSLGKKITKEKAIRSGQVSLSEYDYLSQTKF